LSGFGGGAHFGFVHQQLKQQLKFVLKTAFAESKFFV